MWFSNDNHAFLMGIQIFDASGKIIYESADKKTFN